MDPAENLPKLLRRGDVYQYVIVIREYDPRTDLDPLGRKSLEQQVLQGLTALQCPQVLEVLVARCGQEEGALPGEEMGRLVRRKATRLPLVNKGLAL